MASKGNKTKEKFDAYQLVTDRMIAIMESGDIPWHKEWLNTTGNMVARSHKDGHIYSIMNQMLVGIPGEYATFDQIKAENGRAQKGTMRYIVFYKRNIVPVKDADGNVVIKDGKEVTKCFPVLRYWGVFNTEDCEGVKRKYIQTDESKTHRENNPIVNCEAIVQDYLTRSGVVLKHYEQMRSFYSPAEDKIVLPHLWQFENPEAYYSTAFHEMVHSTGAANRLNRLKSGSFGDEEYSKEELVAEIGAAILCNHAGISNTRTDTNSAAYLQGWLKALKSDKRLIVQAAGAAEKAVKLILNQQDEKRELMQEG